MAKKLLIILDKCTCIFSFVRSNENWIFSSDFSQDVAVYPFLKTIDTIFTFRASIKRISVKWYLPQIHIYLFQNFVDRLINICNNSFCSRSFWWTRCRFRCFRLHSREKQFDNFFTNVLLGRNDRVWTCFFKWREIMFFEELNLGT